MDYMNLGVKSRKTGLRVKNDINKDEFSMERIDDFFNDDNDKDKLDRTPGTATRKWNRSGLSSPHIFSPEVLNSKRSSLLSHSSVRNDPEPFLDDNEAQLDLLQPIFEEDINKEEDEVNSRQTQSYNTTYDLPNKPRNTKNPYTTDYKDDIPDLISDDDTTIDNTYLNTSDNALLEEEISDSYLNDGSTSDEGPSSDSSDNDDNNESELSIVSEDDRTYIPSENEVDEGHNSVAFEEDDISSDGEDYLLAQRNNNAEAIGHDNSGLRRSTRVKVPPLEYWRNEKIVYKRNSDKPVLDIAKIITYEEAPRKKALLSSTTTPSAPRIRRPILSKRQVRIRKVPVKNNSNATILNKINNGGMIEGKWLKDGMLKCDVNIAKDKNTKENELIALAPNVAQMEKTKITKDEKYSIAIAFDKHRDTFASGILKLPIGGNRNSKNSFSTVTTFYVINGVLEVALNGTRFVVIENCSFQIPAFNDYALKNKGNDEVKLFFVQVTVGQSSNSEETRNLTSDPLSELFPTSNVKSFSIDNNTRLSKDLFLPNSSSDS
ncbi:hypothetical protein KAFR_0D03400 [Kazachstania africana CBS 2517]|uniref:CENP-C homolog n=1 Tax=Kazachstania africana (strain ATCC 22294 / BCRC 22015 / CBS 2517 / CECT 1963 / NBRC 1671 / NRRL Y-8276) TaxID=1071382 RepID=H2AUD8_KAZAF|nr:hypothetical protein KAFR_0D03400 [Kazachstania africana CBS 2517]CCF57988.1 hypothetical protein KAFR_0D03400 [Kazachstania africana CBS 2517]